MKQKYYQLPLGFRRFFENGGSFAKCSEAISIDQHIGLLLATCPGEHRFDPGYGCRIWEMDFENIVKEERLSNAVTVRKRAGIDLHYQLFIH